jgi:predicted ATPase
MRKETPLLFGDFQLDPKNECLWRDDQIVKLTPKAFAVLTCLAEQPGQLVTKDDLWQTVWPDIAVTDAALTMCMSEIRKALRDPAKTPRFIETVHRRGYRFLPTVTTQPVRRLEQFGVQSRPKSEPRTPNSELRDSPLVGRESELAQLHNWLDKTLSGERQLVFVTGEAGIGKTTVVEVFLQSLESRVQRLTSANQSLYRSTIQTLDLSIGHGQCIEHFGAGEAYLPILAALGQVGREARGQHFVEMLDQYAPTWLVQMPALLKPADFEGLQRRTVGATRTRMLREMAEAVEVLTSEQPLVLVLEDLHWSDPSTLELLSFVARRRQPARLLVLGTYRPVEVLANGHPLRAVTQELQLHRQSEELPLGFLTEEHVAEYLTVRFTEGAYCNTPLPKLATTIHRRTEGNPLFMVNIVDNLLMQGAVDSQQIENSTPTTIRQMIERQFDHVHPAEQRILEVASVAGVEFSAAAVAAGTNVEVVEVETHCAELARREQFLWRSGQSRWPDGIVAERYRFQHALYQEVIYDRVPASQKAQWHRRIGERFETAYGEQAKEIAAELAVHFERGRDYRRAVHYLQQAGQRAAQRSAHAEAVAHLTRGLELLKTLPDTPERTPQELMLQSALGRALMATKGYAAPEVGKVYARAQDLCSRVGETPQLVPVLWGLFAFYIVRGELQTANELGKQILRIAQSAQDPALLLEAHHLLGQVLYFLGELLPARERLEQGIALYDPQQHHSHAFLYGHDPGVACRGYAAFVLWYLGYPDQAVQRSHEALTLAQGLSHPYSLAYARLVATRLHQLRQEGQTTQEWAEALISLSAEQGFAFFLVMGTILRGGALAGQGQVEEGIAQIRQGLTAFSATGAAYTRAHFLALLAEAHGRIGHAEEGLTLLTEALAVVDKTGERYYEAELHRLKGELTLQQANQKAKGKRQKKLSVISSQLSVPSPQSEAEACFLKAIEVSRHQQAKSLELRAVVSLSRLWQQQGKAKQAHKMLSEIYNWFTEGFETKDLQEAKALLEELSR